MKQLKLKSWYRLLRIKWNRNNMATDKKTIVSCKEDDNIFDFDHNPLLGINKDFRKPLS